MPTVEERLAGDENMILKIDIDVEDSKLDKVIDQAIKEAIRRMAGLREEKRK